MNTLFEDLFNGFPSKFLQAELNPAQHQAPVNIRETEKAYLLELVAPGMDRQDIKVNMDDQLLTISAEKKTNTQQENERVVRREYAFRSFTRSFTLDDSIDTERIQAKYDNGVLHLELPKKEAEKIQPKEISIQ